MSKEAVKQVIQEFGGQVKTATMMNCTQQLIANWVRQGYIPHKHLKGIAKTTKVPLKDLVKPEHLEVYEWLKGQENASV